jgi:diadenosine tetraphosphate (Ap4A) HIT family hydrolase
VEITVPRPEQPSDYLNQLPIGERLPTDPLGEDPLWPFESPVTMKPIDRPILPEPARRGAGGGPCPACTGDHTDAIWEDERWRVVSGTEPHGLPFVAILEPKAHHDLDDLPPGLTSELGQLIQRVARAIAHLDGIGRVHFNRWGDGSEHFHIWFLARPRGMWQMRGAMLAVWDDLLPRVPRDEWLASRRAVAAALAAGGGRDLSSRER